MQLADDRSRSKGIQAMETLCTTELLMYTKKPALHLMMW